VLCGDAGVVEVGPLTDGPQREHFGKIWVPTGATVTVKTTAVVSYAKFGSYWKAGVSFTTRLLTESGSQLANDVTGFGGPDVLASQPKPLDRVGTSPAVTWTNSGSSRYVVALLRSTPSQTGPFSYVTSMVVSGGSGAAAPVPCDLLADSEFFGPNGALRHQCPCMSTVADPVDTRTGNLHMPVPGLSVPGRGPGLSFEPG
jgi:hypothetical protein